MVSRDGSNKRVIKNLNTIRTNYSYLNNSINRLDFTCSLLSLVTKRRISRRSETSFSAS